MGLFDKFKKGLQKTRELTIGKVADLFTGGKIDEDALEELEDALLQADVGVSAVDELIERIRERVKTDKSASGISQSDLLKSELLSIMTEPEVNRKERFSTKPWCIVMVGVNGSGKTTTCGKIAWSFNNSGHQTSIAAGDTFRAAAIEQLEVWADRSKSRIIKQSLGADPAAVTYDAYQSVLSRGEDALIVDTAGRLQDKHNLMKELGKITRILKKFDENLPHEVLLVIDATTGQNGLSQARGFTESAGVTGLVVTKLDGSAKGGVIIPILRELKLPIEFVGMGEGIEDIYPFDAEAYANALLEG